MKLAEAILLDVAQISGEGQLGDENCIAPVGAQTGRVQVSDVRIVKRRGVIAGEDVALRLSQVGVVVAQVERRLLGLERFLVDYANGLDEFGYENSPLEKMAYDAEASFRRSSPVFDAEKFVAEQLRLPR